ncbi:molybdenum cofactor synthesis domain-containing protein [Breoghania corrubedonensis]|uniref:Molybdenum cofactor synthesis domain-containing protein n=1 Tax=Breoghania corrubedonensis TaxID=665038 RepID=A0A2T5VD40_9HYPH|nr:molybdopterin-binding protein [Breoghania corrubedonensis]PTW61661.1 molybdenum cofactor synthesis domain-containing protein [Breoghania corrubedonensis]
MGEAANSADDDIVTAGFVVIGDEILSGRTKDKNIGYLADFLTAHGIDLAEVRIVPDETGRIVEAVRALSARYTHVFTSGGIGPTHDDITADAIAAAFGVGIDFHPEAVALLSARYGNADLTQARMRMARIPDGASLIPNSVSQAPGFKIGNVHVMAGVPAVFEAMLEALGPTLAHGRLVLSRAIEAHMAEGRVADDLRRIQDAHTGVAIGSYPQYDGKTYSTQLVVRSRDEALLERVVGEIEEALARLRAEA